MKRMAKAKGQPYLGSGLSRNRKRKGFLKAIEFFETVREGPVKTSKASLVIERIRELAREMILGWK